MGPQLLLLITVATVGVLHTVVPDHWLPISLLARQEGWTRRETAVAAAGAGVGHSLSTLAIGIVIWLAGAALATKFAGTVSTVASLALIGFGLWIALGSLRDLRGAGHGHSHGHHGHHHHGHGHSHHHPHPHSSQHTEAHGHHSHSHPYEPGHTHAEPHGAEEDIGHRHRHRHAEGRVHTHYHRHTPTSWHVADGNVAVALAPVHEHDHPAAPRRALMLILGSSPMVEGIPAFLAASRYGLGLIATMALLFTVSTVVTYVALCVSSAAAVERVHLGPFERYGEVISGAFIAAVGLVFLVWLQWYLRRTIHAEASRRVMGLGRITLTVVILAVGVILAPAQAQQTAKIARVGFLAPQGRSLPLFDAFRKGLPVPPEMLKRADQIIQ